MINAKDVNELYMGLYREGSILEFGKEIEEVSGEGYEKIKVYVSDDEIKKGIFIIDGSIEFIATEYWGYVGAFFTQDKESKIPRFVTNLVGINQIRADDILRISRTKMVVEELKEKEILKLTVEDIERIVGKKVEIISKE